MVVAKELTDAGSRLVAGRCPARGRAQHDHDVEERDQPENDEQDVAGIEQRE